MSRAMSISTSHNTDQPNLFSAATQCFIDDSMDSASKKQARNKVDEHKSLLLPIIDSYPNPSQCASQFKKLADCASKTFDPASDDPNICIIVESGVNYLTCGAAELDVLRVSPFFRSMLYQVGTAATPNEEMLLQRSTFVPTKKMNFIVDEFKHLVLFVLRTNPNLIKEQLRQATQIHDFVIEHFSSNMDEDEMLQETCKRVIDTNILFGMMIAILLEEPTGLKPNTLQLYLVGRGLKSVATRSYLQFHHANGMSKNCNSLLRLMRHCICAHICTTARDERFDYASFRNDTTRLLKVVQTCDSISSVCRTIRMAKEIDRKEPANVLKCFNPKTGEVMVQQIYIKKEVWSKAIPTTIEDLKHPLYDLFHCHQLLDAFLDIGNKLVMSGEDVYVYIKGKVNSVQHYFNHSYLSNQITTILLQDTNDKVQVSEIIPVLNAEYLTPSEVQMHVNKLWSLNQFILLYLSSGAGRGLELTRLHSFSKFQEYFNCLRFYMRSEKNILHGVDNNMLVPHFIPPSLARFIIILNVVLYPAVVAHPILTLPSIDDAPKKADLMFRKVMKLDASGPTSSRASNLGCKLNRDLCGQIMNYISPSACGRFTTKKENAAQMHHSPAVHSASYSSTILERMPNGELREPALFVAEEYWNALGENVQAAVHQSSGRDFTVIDSSYYNLAAQRALRDATKTCYDYQMEACKSIDDTSDHHDVVVHIAPGYGKSGLWNFTLLARSICGSKRQRSIVICPYNAVLAQQKIKSKHYFAGTNLTVYCITSSTLEKMVNLVIGFDLLYISIDAFNTLRQSYIHELESWGVKVIYIDEFHLCLGETYRHDTSWQGLRNVKALNTKIVIVTATTNVTATKMIAAYVGIQENIITIGGASSYTVPNVAFTIRDSSNANLLNDVANHVKQRLPTSLLQNKAIHIITVSKEEAVNVARIINESGIRAEWLTSDCTEHERVSRMAEWDDGKIPVLASTYCVGLDNAKVKEVIIMGGCRSAADVLQSAGRIRPAQQQGENTEVIIWLSDSTWKIRNDEMQQKQDYRLEAHLFDCFNEGEERVEAMREITNLYEFQGLDGIVYGRKSQCIMKGLHSRIGVTTSECGMCQLCKSGINRQLTFAAREQEEVLIQKKILVTHWMGEMAKRCIACDSSDCDGFKCVIGNDQQSGRWCIRCYGYTGQVVVGTNNFHSHETCELRAKNITTKGRSCPYCFTAVGADIPDSGTREQHDKERCQFKHRVKRVLLHGHTGRGDFGLAARKTIIPALQNHDLWFELMAQNIGKIMDSKVQR